MRIPKTYQRISDAFTIKGLNGNMVSEGRAGARPPSTESFFHNAIIPPTAANVKTSRLYPEFTERPRPFART